jgi:Phage tail sheath C-terminal domain
MALISPGVQVTITDESQYLPSAVGSIPFVVIATEQDKLINGAVAPGTTKSKAGAIYAISSQRELINTFGAPIFKRSSAGTPIHGDQLNEYGLLAAYSALGLGNRVYVVRADIDIAKLSGTSVRPKGEVATGTNWLDISDTSWGIFEFNYSGSGPVVFTEKTSDVLTISSSAFTESTSPFKPLNSVGNEGQYAVVTRTVDNLVYYKTWRNEWVGLGSEHWASNVPVITGTKTGSQINISTTGNIEVGTELTINGELITISTKRFNLTNFASDINTVLDGAGGGAYARANSQDRLELYGRKVTGVNTTGNVVLQDGVNRPLYRLGLLGDTPAAPHDPTYAHVGNLTVMNNQYTVSWDWDPVDQIWYGSTTISNRADIQYSPYYNIPNWASTTSPRPNKSVWVKTTSQGNGVNLNLKQYSRISKDWRSIITRVYEDAYAAVYDLDKGGGININSGTTFVMHDPLKTGQVGFKMYSLKTTGVTRVTGASYGTWSSSPANGNTFILKASQTNGIESVNTCTIAALPAGAPSTNVNAQKFAQAVLLQNIPNVTAEVEANGAVTLIHRSGGIISLTDITGTAVEDAGFITGTAGVDDFVGGLKGDVHLSNWTAVSYEVSTTRPVLDPQDGALWYYDDLEVDIMIADSTSWKGYRNVSLDVRGYNLTSTDPNGVIFASVEPDQQSTGAALVSGDLWIDTSDLANYPKLYRYDLPSLTWNLIDKTDRLTQNGIIFADARWATTGDVDPVKDTMPKISDLVTSDYIDLDCPDYRLFPRGTLLFNTRRSGYLVKKFVANYFNAVAYPNSVLPSEKSSWVAQVGFAASGEPLMGIKAQRNEIVSAMKGAIDSNPDLREEFYNYNLLVAPGYPELIPNLVNLNSDRGQTGFVIGDTPLTLPNTATDIINYDANEISISSPYLAIYYPAGLSNDLNGNQVAVPASHMALRTYLYNDQVAYQWFAPAGTRRGLVDNSTDVGFVDANSGRFIRSGLNQQIRDTMYEKRINPIAKITGVGLAIYGQKTRNPSVGGGGTSLDRVNVARLVNFLRVVLQGVANQFLFEPNDKITRDQIKVLIEGLLNDLIAKRGIYDYVVVCDETNNTSERIARNELYVDVAIEPVRAVEFIYIPIRLRNPGAAGQSSIGTQS